MSYGNLQGRVCFVAGASSGMGRRSALALAEAGARVVVAARRKSLCDDLAADIVRAGGDALALELDGTDPASAQATIDAIDSHYGRLDGVFNNLGHTFGHGAFDETPLERWHDTLSVNLTAVFYLLRAEIPLLLRSGGGAIVNNSSTGGLQGVRAMADYSAAKWGVIGLTRSVALEYADRQIRCNVIAPGIIATEKFEEFRAQSPEIFEQLQKDIPSQQFGDMQDIAAAVVWLLSSASRYINGATIPIDAGRTA
ncbi:MAG: SDR family NAD(P)-dependent oxidoreductase [Pseudomonadota bacterium]